MGVIVVVWCCIASEVGAFEARLGFNVAG